MQDLVSLLAASSARHRHLCPRQVLGVRMALAAGGALGLELPRADKALIVIAETDGCFSDGLAVAAGVSPGHRSLRVEDYGKVAATFANARTGEAVRLVPRSDVRLRARLYAPVERRHYYAQLAGYQLMPDEELFSLSRVVLTPGIERIIGRAGARTNCCVCGEEIINQREIEVDGLPYCRACLGGAYYQPEGVGVARPRGRATPAAGSLTGSKALRAAAACPAWQRRLRAKVLRRAPPPVRKRRPAS